MKNILVIGAGRSAISLIKYLLDAAEQKNWHILITDRCLETAKKAVGNHKNCTVSKLNININEERIELIKLSDIVVSMLPAHMHYIVAKDCVSFKKNMVTASYVSEDIRSLGKDAKKSNIILLNEMGLDPGIDHMSAMKVIKDIHSKKGKIKTFKSFCGGLVHPDFDNNPWNYKFTWNPRNVVLAGQGTAQYLELGSLKCIPYTNLFKKTEKITVLDAGEFEAYANRDSNSYINAYGLKNVENLMRGTLRKKGYCDAWNVFVQLGMTDDTYNLNIKDLTNRKFINTFLSENSLSVEEKLCQEFNFNTESIIFKKLKWLGVFDDIPILNNNVSPAKILEDILKNKWKLDKNDKDMVVMQHYFEYMQSGQLKKLTSSLVVYGDTPKYTAMAKTVGLPVAIAVELILENKIKLKGVQIPTIEEIYIPVLNMLENFGISFVEESV
tara:strand:+ start:117775 stop:119097 length:1323 start_codon:yes stop_codon:yes gene_type:complete